MNYFVYRLCTGYFVSILEITSIGGGDGYIPGGDILAGTFLYGQRVSSVRATNGEIDTYV
jgi:hypothetical protein